MTVREGSFRFDFSAAASWERLDEMGRSVPQGMAMADFLVEERSRLLLIEVKDPFSEVGRRPSKRREGEKLFRVDRLIHQSLVPKARDSYTYLHLMGKDTKPVLYVVLLGFDRIGFEPAFGIVMKDRLLSRLRREAHRPWIRDYIADCLVLDPENWARAFPEYPLVRIPAGE